jgi:RimJ/RimL family protein N-acetyltransferase
MPPTAPAVAPTLSDGMVTLRVVTPDDVEGIYEQSTDAETLRWTTLWEGYSRADAREFMERTGREWATGERATWAVRHEGRFAGLTGYRRRGDRAVEVSFAAHPAARGQGVTTNALRLAISHAFETGADVAFWHALVGNFGSRRVAWRLGFRIDGPVSNVVDGVVRDFWAGRLLRGEPMEPRTRWLAAPRIEVGGIRLRPFREDDADVFPERLDRDAADHISLAMPTRDGYPDWLLGERGLAASGEAVSVAVAAMDGDTVLGGLRLSRLGLVATAGTANLAYWLLDHARGQGILGKALDLLVPWTFRAEAEGGLGLHRLEAGYVLDNRASGRVLRRAGFAPVGTERRKMVVGGDPADVRDAMLFDLLATDDREAQRVEPGELPVIETERFRLRPWTPGDVPGPGEEPDAASLRFMPAGAHPDVSSYSDWLQRRQLGQDSNEYLNWAIADRETDHALGNITVFRLDPVANRFQGEIGYWLHPTARGRGVLGEVVPVMVDHAFAPVSAGGMGLTRLYAETDLENAVSQAVLLRAGFRLWGQDRQAFRNGAGDVTDGAYFELLATEERFDRRPRRVVDVTLEGDHVRLRPWRDDDAPRIVEGCRDGRSKHWLAGLPDPYTLDDALAYLRWCRGEATAGRGLFLAMADPDDDVCVGSIALTKLAEEDPTSGEVGYWAHPATRGSGVTTEAVRRLVEHAFEPASQGGLGLRRLELRAAAGNVASQHVAEANGFHRTGMRRQAERLGDGSWDDLVDYDLLAADLHG